MTSSQVQDTGGGGGWYKGKLIDDRFELIEAGTWHYPIWSLLREDAAHLDSVLTDAFAATVSLSEDSCLWEGYDQARSSPVILSRLEYYDEHGRIPGSLR
jgi:hypothetical protein